MILDCAHYRDGARQNDEALPDWQVGYPLALTTMVVVLHRLLRRAGWL